MSRSRLIITLRWVFASFLWISIILGIWQLQRYKNAEFYYPAGTIIAGVPVGGLDRQQSAQRLQAVYYSPVELHYGQAIIDLSPSEAGFDLSLDSMLFKYEEPSSQVDLMLGFWRSLWGDLPSPMQIPLQASFTSSRLRTYLQEEIAARYDKPPSSPMPVVGMVDFQPGVEGISVDIEATIPLIEKAFRSTSTRSVDLPLKRIPPPPLLMENLEILLKQTIDLQRFDGLVGFYLKDLRTAREINFAYQGGKDVPIPPDVAFTAASIIKIPIMVSIFRQIGDNPDAETVKLLQDMIEESGNEAADWVMQRAIGGTLAPLEVTADMQALGLDNTFLAGYFNPGAPILRLFQTPANQRSDINTDPDIYSQTTPSDIGMLLEDIYQCSQSGGGTLAAVFQDDITQSECQTMIQYLTLNRMPALIEAGLPLGTHLAHKHGWVSLFGIIHTIGDAGIIYSPSGDYVLVIFLYHPNQLVWDPSRKLVSTLSEAVYNFVTIPYP